MIKPEKIPDKVVEAAARASATQLGVNWDDAGDFVKNGWRSDARIAIAAALAAWPDRHIHEWQRPWLGGVGGIDLVLPLTENSDD